MIGPAWLDVAVPLLAAAALLAAPGLIAVTGLRVGLIARIAFAGVAGVLSIGAAGILASLVRIPFAPWQPLLPALVILGTSMVMQRRGPRAALLPRESVRRWWIVLVWIASAVATALIAFTCVPDPARISQTYDNVFHLSGIAHILHTGDGSSLTLRSLIETDRTFAYYPAAWHDLVALTVQLTGSSIPVAVNASWIAVCAMVWLPGCAWLAQLVAHRFEAGRVTLVALPIAACSGAMPYALLNWGSLYPTAVATAMLPVAVGIPCLAWSCGRSGPLRIRGCIALSLAFVAACAAVALGQPRVLATLVVILLPLAAGVAFAAFRRSWRQGGRSRQRAVAATAAAGGLALAVAAGVFLYAVLRLGLFTRPLDERLGGGQARATQSIAAGFVQVLTQSWLTGVGTVTFPALLLALATMVGLLVLARTPGSRWIVVAIAILATLFAVAAGSDAVLAKLLTAVWYKDRYRLSSAIPVLGVPVATFGILISASWATRRAPRWRPALAGAFTLGTFATAVLALAGMISAIGLVFRLPPSHAGDAVVSREQTEFFARSADLVPAGQRVLGDPWDGSALSAVFGGREPVFPHVNGQYDVDRLALAYRLDRIATDPTVCSALNTLRVRFILYDPHTFGGGDPSGNHFPAVHRAVERKLFVRVAGEGDTSLYRIEQCGPLPARGAAARTG